MSFKETFSKLESKLLKTKTIEGDNILLVQITEDPDLAVFLTKFTIQDRKCLAENPKDTPKGNELGSILSLDEFVKEVKQRHVKETELVKGHEKTKEEFEEKLKNMENKFRRGLEEVRGKMEKEVNGFTPTLAFLEELNKGSMEDEYQFRNKVENYVRGMGIKREEVKRVGEANLKKMEEETDATIARFKELSEVVRQIKEDNKEKAIERKREEEIKRSIARPLAFFLFLVCLLLFMIVPFSLSLAEEKQEKERMIQELVQKQNEFEEKLNEIQLGFQQELGAKQNENEEEREKQGEELRKLQEKLREIEEDLKKSGEWSWFSSSKPSLKQQRESIQILEGNFSEEKKDF